MLTQLTDNQKILVNELQVFPLRFCSALFFGDPSDGSVSVNNGTMTLIKYNNKRFGITNYHVIQKYRTRKASEPNIKLGIGNAEINLEQSLIDQDEEIDLCTISLDDYKESDFNAHGDINTNFYDVDDFTTGSLQEGDFVMLGGFPGTWRQQPRSNHLIFDSLSSGAIKVNDVSDVNLRCEIALEESIVNGKYGRDEIPENLGGMSGGPVFLRYTNQLDMFQFKLVGIIYQHSPNFDSIFIRPISLINDELCIKR